MSLAQAFVTLPEPDADAELVARHLNGEPGAFDQLVRKYQQPLQLHARRMLGDADEAADVVQRALVRAHRALPELRAGQSFRAWIFRITITQALSALRQRKLRGQTELADDSATVAAEGASGLEQAETQARLRAAIASLPPKQRVVVELRVFDELPFREVAEIAGCSENAAKVQFHHALKKLRVLMGESA
jgi:RNA polymerase sigma-70 factor (ECF subfamily)